MLQLLPWLLLTPVYVVCILHPCWWLHYVLAFVKLLMTFSVSMYSMWVMFVQRFERRGRRFTNLHYYCNRVYCMCFGLWPFNLYFLSLLFFDWVGVLWPQLSKVLKLVRWARRVMVQELCESRGGRPGLSVLTSHLVFVDVKLYWTMLRHWSQLVPNMSADIWGH